MGKKSNSTSAQTSTQIAEDNRLASSGLGNTGSISGSTVTDSSSNFDPIILENAFKYLGQSDAMMTDRAFATLAVADNSASNIVDAAGKFAETTAQVNRDILEANNAALSGMNTLANNTTQGAFGLAQQSLGQGVSLANIGLIASKDYTDTAKDFGTTLVNAANSYTQNAFKSGMDATGAAYNAVSEINSAASDGASVIPDLKQQILVAVVSGALIYAFTRAK